MRVFDIDVYRTGKRETVVGTFFQDPTLQVKILDQVITLTQVYKPRFPIPNLGFYPLVFGDQRQFVIHGHPEFSGLESRTGTVRIDTPVRDSGGTPE